jgi:hypothetical protein
LLIGAQGRGRGCWRARDRIPRRTGGQAAPRLQTESPFASGRDGSTDGRRAETSAGYVVAEGWRVATPFMIGSEPPLESREHAALDDGAAAELDVLRVVEALGRER